MTPPDQAGAATGAAAMERGATGAPPVPGFISAKDLARGDKLFFGASRSMRGALGALAMLAAATSIGAVVATASGVMVPHEALLAAVAAVLGFSACWFFATVLRRHPARVCYLGANMKQGAAHFMRELRPYGHIIFCRTGGKAADAAKVASALRNRFMLNLRAVFSDRETFAVSASRDVIGLLARSSDALIVDLSNGAPEDWSAIQAQASRCVFVSAWGKQEQAEAAFASLGLPGQCFFYAPDGEIQRRGPFRAAMLAAMRAAHAA